MAQKTNRQIIGILFAERCSCVIRKGEDIRIFHERGVKDLYHLLKEEPEFLSGAFIADKVVGKAAAALMILGGVKEVFADVISSGACKLLNGAHVQVGYAIEVPYIINRTQTGWCPLEKRCFGVGTPEECVLQIEEFIQTMK